MSFSGTNFVDIEDGNVKHVISIVMHEQKLNGKLEHTEHIVFHLLMSFELTFEFNLNVYHLVEIILIYGTPTIYKHCVTLLLQIVECRVVERKILNN